MFSYFKNKIEAFVFRLLIIFLPSSKTDEKENLVGVTTLLCHRDVNMCIYSLTSFFYGMKKSFPVFIIDDGSLTKLDKKKLARFFTVIIPSQRWCEDQMKIILKEYPSFREFRFSSKFFSNVMRKKFDAFFLNPFKRFIYLDADILFYQKPNQILDWLSSEENVGLYSIHKWKDKMKTDDDFAMIIRRLLRKFFSSTASHLYFSCGMIGFPNKKCLNLNFLDRIFKLIIEVKYAKYYPAEEDSLIVLFSKIKSKILPAKEYLNLWLSWQYNVDLLGNINSLHYAGEVKPKFKKDAILLVIKNRFFRK